MISASGLEEMDEFEEDERESEEHTDWRSALRGYKLG
jgi:hypothetical protein